jgi:futalosine hydrolase
VVTAVEREAIACRSFDGAIVVAGGVGRTNAAVTTTRALLQNGPFDAILSAGVAGALPESGLAIGDVVVGSSAIYAEEGILTPEGFQDMRALGISPGDFPGNELEADRDLLSLLASLGRCGPIATVATCSGTDEAATMIRERTKAVAEAMEGAAVLHAARLFGCPAIELRVISNTTGNRSRQEWKLERALDALSRLAEQAGELLLRG